VNIEVIIVPHSHAIAPTEKFENWPKNIEGINPKLEKNTSFSF
jgi:hypothetical protein